MEKWCNHWLCRGKINFERGRMIEICEGGKTEFVEAFPCSVCGLMHTIEHTNIFYKDTDKMLYLKKEELVLG